MSSFFAKHLMFSSNVMPTSMGDLRRYEGFFPNMTGATYDPISLLKDDRSSESRGFLSGSLPNDYGSLNTSCSLSSGEDSVGSSQTSVPSSDAVPVAMKTLQKAKELLRTPQKTPEQRISPRKPLKPVKSVNPSDPRFKGVTLRLKTSLSRSRKSSRKSPAQLLIDCCFSVKKKRQSEDVEVKTPRRRRSSSILNPSIFRLDHPEDELSLDGYAMDLDLGVAPLHVEKECASCGTYRTPLWRDAEDGTPLCNACGIRYKKYRIRCVRCWYIPKKEEKALPCCTSCGHHFKITLARRGNSFTCE